MKTNVILVPMFGFPGSGKGSVMNTLKKLSETSPNISIITVEMGAYFRKKAESNSSIRDIMDSGNLISNSMVNEVFEGLLNEAVAAPLLNGEYLKNKMIVLLDGYPRSIPQWEHFLAYRKSKNLAVAGVFLELSEDVVLHRSTIRRICPKCGGTFSIEQFKACPDCGKPEGIRRADDLKMKRRIAVFKEATFPVIYEAKSIIEHKLTVDSSDTHAASLQIWAFFQNL